MPMPQTQPGVPCPRPLPARWVTVQYLLNCVPASQGGPSPELVVNGAVGPKTIKAIETF